MKAITLTLCAAILLCAASAQAVFNLQVTEIYPGHSVEADVTNDWFELTNYGDTAWDSSVDGPIFFDDDSQDPLVADQLMDVASIAPGQSVIFVEGDDAAVVGEFLSVFSNVSGLTVGWYSGSGLSGGGDGVTVFSGMTNFPDPPIVGALLDFESYPDLDAAVVGGVADGATWDVVNQRWSVEGVNGAIASAEGGAFPIIGSPGSAVPEPASFGLTFAALLAVSTLRRQR